MSSCPLRRWVLSEWFPFQANPLIRDRDYDVPDKHQEELWKFNQHVRWRLGGLCALESSSITITEEFRFQRILVWRELVRM